MLRRRLLSLAPILLVAAACSGGGNTVEGFCEVVDEFDRTTGDTDLAGFAAMVDAAPGDIRDDLALVSDVLTQLSTLEDTDADYARSLELTEDVAFLAAGDRAEAYVLEHCDVRLSGEPAPAAPLEPTTVLGIDDHEIADFIDSEFSLAEFVLGRRIIGGADGVVTVEIDGGDRSVDAVAACREISRWMASQPGARGVVILDVHVVDADDDGIAGPDQVLVRNGSVGPDSPGVCSIEAR